MTAQIDGNQFCLIRTPLVRRLHNQPRNAFADISELAQESNVSSCTSVSRRLNTLATTA